MIFSILSLFAWAFFFTIMYVIFDIFICLPEIIQEAYKRFEEEDENEQMSDM